MAPPRSETSIQSLLSRSRQCSRRDALRLAGLGLVATLPGCSILSSSSPRYSLTSSPRGGTTLTDLFAWEPRQGTLHVRHHVDALVAELLDSGEVTTEAQPMGPYEPDGTAPPAYAEHEGAYYRVRVTGVEAVSLDRWEFWFEPVEQAPDGVEPVENPAEGLSELDAEIVDWAARDAVGAVVGDEDLATAPHGDRGVVFFEPMRPDDSDLVPDPPFEYVRVEPDTEFLSEKQTLRARAERGTVDAKRYVHETERVADSESELEKLLAEHVDATLDDTSDEVRDIVDEVSVRSGIYAEREPISDAFERVLERLGVDDPTPPDETGASRAWRRHYEYRDDYYRTTLRIRND